MSKIIQLPKAYKGPIVINATETEAEILIYDYIGSSWFFEGVTAKTISEELAKISDKVKEIKVRINSGGGSVFEGMTIYERLKSHKAKKTVYIDGLAASIASVIAMCGDKVIMGEGAQFMVHKPWTWTEGNDKDHEAAIVRLGSIEHQMLNIYQRKCAGKTSRAELEDMVAKETWITGDKAVEMGFADELSRDAVNIAASTLRAPWLNLKGPPPVKATDVARALALVSKVRKDIGDNLARK